MHHKQNEQTPSVIDDTAERQSVFWGETAARLLVLPATTARFPFWQLILPTPSNLQAVCLLKHLRLVSGIQSQNDTPALMLTLAKLTSLAIGPVNQENQTVLVLDLQT